MVIERSSDWRDRQPRIDLRGRGGFAPSLGFIVVLLKERIQELEKMCAISNPLLCRMGSSRALGLS